MRQSEDKHSWLASYEELQSLTGLLAITANPLGIITGKVTPADAGIKAEWDKYQAAQQESLRAMLITLVSPQQTIHLAWTIGDFHYQRVTLSRLAGQKELVWLAQQSQEDLYQLQTLAADEVNLLLNDILKLASLGDDNSSQTLSAAAVISLLGTADLMRQRYHQSMLDHQPANNSMTAEQVQTVLASAQQVDFRWPICFWEKNLPIDITAMTGKIPGAMHELSLAGWLQTSSGQFQFTDNGIFMAEEMLNEQAKVAITIAATDGQEIVIQDSLLLVRGSQDLWLYYILGEQGGVGQVGATGWKAFSEALLSPPEKLAEVPEAKAAEADNPNDVAKFCPHCGKGIKPGTKFCGSCGGAL